MSPGYDPLRDAVRRVLAAWAVTDEEGLSDELCNSMGWLQVIFDAAQKEEEE
jgi:hypothetical protein